MASLYPDDLLITGEHVRQSGWKSFIGEPDDFHGPDWESALAGAKEAAEEGNREHAKILSLLGRIGSMMFADDMPQAPFVPTFSGRERRTPLPEDLTENDLEALQIILPELDDHRLRARIADILWLRLKPRKVDHALAAIDAYREYPLQGRGFTWESRKAWKRAIYLAGLIRDPGKSRLAVNRPVYSGGSDP